MLADFKYALRSLAKTPGFTFVAVATLTLCIGANSAIFSVVNAILLKPYPWPGSERLAYVGNVFPKLGSGGGLGNMSIPDYVDHHTGVPSFAESALISGFSVNLSFDGNPERVYGLTATPSLFNLLQTRPAIGRTFTDAEAEPGAGKTVVLNYPFWKARFAGDPAIIGQTLAKNLWPEGDALGQRIQYADHDAARAPKDGGGAVVSADENVSARASDAQTIEIVGIVPDITTSLFKKKHRESAIYVPYALGFQSNVQFHVRTAANTPAVAATLIDSVRREVREAAPGVPVFKVRTFRQHLDASADLWITRIGATLFSIFGCLALVLAVVGLYGVKAYSVARRTREIGIRLALGAEPGKVQAMILCEGLVMTLTGAALGLLLAFGLGRVCANLLYYVSPTDPLAFTLAPAVLFVTAMVACWLPARRATKVNPLEALRAE